MSRSSQKFILATKQVISGHQRKLAWLSLHGKDLYFELAGMLEGSHNSYHKDGSIWRTSLATDKRAKYVKHHYPLEHFQGWFHLGLGMLLKSSLPSSPELKSKDRKHTIEFIDIDEFPSEALNIVVDLLESGKQELLETGDMLPPVDTYVVKFVSKQLEVYVSILGHDHNLLISPYYGEPKGVTCRHINKRYSANPPGRHCAFEAYKLD